MADYCSLKNHGKFQTLKKSGLSDSIILDRMSQYKEYFGILPELDDLPGSNSLPSLKKEISMKSSIKGTNYTSVNKILAATNTNSIQEANAALNNSHRDLDIEIQEIGDTAFIKVKQRPSEYNILDNTVETNIPEDINQQKVGLQKALDKMRECYGINITYIDNDELVDNVDVNSAKAFIKDGTIYINVDNATIDSPIHEMLHLFIGSISFSNPQLFQQLMSIVSSLPNIEEKIALFGGSRTMNDILEEIFVEELSKFVTGQSSLFDNLQKDIISQVLYNIKRDIDTIIDGNYSVKSLEDNEIFNKSIRNLAEELESSVFNIGIASGLNSAMTHRILANTKSDLLKSGELREECN